MTTLCKITSNTGGSNAGAATIIEAEKIVNSWKNKIIDYNIPKTRTSSDEWSKWVVNLKQVSNNFKIEGRIVNVAQTDIDTFVSNGGTSTSGLTVQTAQDVRDLLMKIFKDGRILSIDLGNTWNNVNPSLPGHIFNGYMTDLVITQNPTDESTPTIYDVSIDFIEAQER